VITANNAGKEKISLVTLNGLPDLPLFAEFPV
jgi:hypothetical protein